VVAFSNNERDLLEFVQKVLNCGGTIIQKNPRKENHEMSYTLQYTCNAAITACEKMQPFCKHNKKQKRIQHILNNYKKVTLRNRRYNAESLERKLRFEEEFFSLG